MQLQVLHVLMLHRLLFCNCHHEHKQLTMFNCCIGSFDGSMRLPEVNDLDLTITSDGCAFAAGSLSLPRSSVPNMFFACFSLSSSWISGLHRARS